MRAPSVFAILATLVRMAVLVQPVCRERSSPSKARLSVSCVRLAHFETKVALLSASRVETTLPRRLALCSVAAMLGMEA